MDPMSLPQIPTAQELLERNKAYISTHQPISKIPSAEAFKSIKSPIIISCIDARIIPEEFFGIHRGEIPVIRNAGGRAKEAVFNIAVLDTLINVNEIIIVHHTDCGLTHATDDILRESLTARSKEEAAKIEFDGFTFTDIPKSVREDIEFLKSHPFVRKETNIIGYVFDIESGELKLVET